VRAGAIIPMLPTDVRTLGDADYVDDPTIVTRTDDLLLQVYPAERRPSRWSPEPRSSAMEMEQAAR
jgi:hypothetical protein